MFANGLGMVRVPQGMHYTCCVCPAWASLSYLRYGINLEGASLPGGQTGPLWAGVTLRLRSGQAL